MRRSALALAEDNLDSVKVDPAHHRILFENDQVRVLRWFVAAGDTTLHHSHPNNLNICLTDYNGKVTVPDSKAFKVEAKAGSVTWRQAGSHAVENLSSQPMEGIIVEPKQPASTRPAGSPDPVAVDPQHHTIEFENEQIRVLRERREPGNIPLHGHPDNVQVPLTDWKVTLTTADGKTDTVIGKAGEVRWRPATQHKGAVLSEKPVEQILVEMKGKPGSRH
jgi:quercetin dioxygenase-like cupin family protein